MLGRKKLEEWMIKPLMDIEKIKWRQLGIEIMMQVSIVSVLFTTQEWEP